MNTGASSQQQDLKQRVTADAYIGLGSNLGDREAYLAMARQILFDQIDQVELIAFSPIIETSPVGGPTNQGAYLNAVAQVRTTLTPRQLLTKLLAIELAAGRVRREKWGPRVLDLDLLLFGPSMIINESGLTVPHPHMHERLFVLEPLAMIAPDVEHPILKRAILDLYEDLERGKVAQP